MCTQNKVGGGTAWLVAQASKQYRVPLYNRVDKTKVKDNTNTTNPHTWYRVARNSATPSGAPLPHTCRTATRESREHVRVQASR